MFFGGDDEDNDFMSSGGGGSKLASLFGMDKASAKGGNESLTYTAPKQPPKKKESSPEGGTAPAILCASVVHAYKYVDNQYASQGKLGSAVLGNQAAKDYRLLLYVSKQQQVTNAKISPSFQFRVQANNYASFYDEGRQSWSVMFDKEETVIKFAKEIALSRANTTDHLDSVIIQDLAPGDGGQLEVEDSAEIRYTGWLMTNHTYGKVFDSNATSEKLFRFKLGKGKVIKGWETGILGMKKNGKRLLIVPPSFGYGSQGMGDRIPANSTLIFEVEVIRVKLQKGESPTPSPAPTPVIEQKGHDEDGETVKVRSKSISEQMAQSPKSDKAKLISRMAKMGKPMLPLTGAVPAQPEEEFEGEPESPQLQRVETSPQPIVHPKPVLPSKPAAQPIAQPTPIMAQPLQQPMVQPMMQQNALGQPMQQQPAFVQNLPGAQQLAVFQSNNILQQQQQAALAMQQQQNMSAFQPAGYQYGTLPQGQQQQPAMPPQYPGAAPPANPPTSQSSSVDSLAPVLLTETRQQNTEVRLSVSKIADKVDRILEKVNMMGPGGMMAGGMSSMHAPTMETGVLLQNINRIVQENETLKKDVYEKSAKIENQNEKIAELLQKNQKYVEQSNTMLEERNEGYKSSANQSQAKVLSLEQEKVNLATELSAATAQLSTLHLELTNSRKTEAELKQKVQSQSDTSSLEKEEMNRLKIQRADDEKTITDLNATLREEKKHRKSMETHYNSMQEEHSDLKTAYETLERNLNERKRKANEERRKLEEEMEDMKINLEGEVQSLRDRLRKQRTSTDVEAADKVVRLEEEISRELQKKNDKLLKAAADKHERALQEVKEEKDELQRKIHELEKKLQTYKSSSGSNEQRVTELEAEVEDLSVWRDKYNNIRTQATTMKERYEERINELEEERDVAEEKIQELQIQTQKLRQAAASAVAAAANAEPPVAGDVVAEVKKIMNSVYRGLREDFEADESYTGSEVLSAILSAIKTTTLQLVQRQQSEGGKTENEDEEEEDEEEEDNEEEEEEEAQAKVIEEKVVQKEVKTEQKIVKEVPVASAAPVKETPEVIESSSINETPKEAQISDTVPEGSEVSGSASTPEEDNVVPVSVDSVGDSEEVEQTEVVAENTELIEELKEEKAEEEKAEEEKDEEEKDEDESEEVEDSKLETVAAEPEREIPSQDTEEVNSSEKLGVDELDADPSPSEPITTEVVLTMSSSKKQGSKGRKSGSKAKPAVVEPVMSRASNQPTGDKGNPYHHKELDKAKPAEAALTSSKQGSLAAAPKQAKQPVEPMMAKASSQPSGDKGNPYHKQALDKAKPVEESMTSTSNKGLHAAPGKSSHPVVVEPMMSSAHSQPAGDKGNPYHKQALDKAKPVEEAMTSSASSNLNAAPEKTSSLQRPLCVQPKMSSSKSQPTGDKGNPYHKRALDKTKPVEEEMTSSSNKGLHAAPGKSSHPIVVEPTMSSAHSQPTGDKGNPYHKQDLNKAKPVEEAMTSSSNKGLHAAPGKSSHPIVVEPMMNSAHSQPTGDKGNPYHKQDLNKAKPVEEAMTSSSNKGLHAAPGKSSHPIVVEPMMNSAHSQPTGDKGNPYHKQALDKSKPVEEAMTSSSNKGLHAAPGKSSHPIVVEPMMNSAHSQPTGDKGNPYHKQDLNKAKPVEEAMTSSSNKGLHAAPGKSSHPIVVEPMMSSAHSQPTGDKGNPYHKQGLDKVKPVEEAMTSSSNKGLHAAPGKSSHPIVVEPMMSSAHSQPTGDKGNPYHKQALDKAKPVEEAMTSSSNKGLHATPGKSSHPIVVEPMMNSAHSQPTGDKGNPYHKQDLNKAKPVEEAMTSSSNKGLHAAPGKSSHPIVVEPMMNSAHSQPTGDKGNPYHKQALDKSKPVEEAMTSSSNKGLHAAPGKSSHPIVVEPMMNSAHSQPTGDKGNPYHKQDLNKAKPVEEAMTSSSNKGLHAAPGKSSHPIVVEPMMSSAHSQPTGDKGNPYHKQGLDKVKPVEEAMTSSSNKGLHAAPGKSSHPIVVEPMMSSAHSQPTGDKGNPYHKQALDKAKPVEEAMTSSSNKGLHATPGKSSHPIVVEPMMSSAHSQPTGDKGNPYHKQDLNKAKPVEEAMTSTSNKGLHAAPGKSSHPIVVEPMMSSAHSQPTGDKGNPYHKQALDKSKPVEEAMTSSLNKGLHAAPGKSSHPIVVEPMMSSAHSQPIGDKGNPYHKQELDKAKPVEEKMTSSSSKGVSSEPKTSGSSHKSMGSKSPSQNKPAVIEPMVSSSASQTTGDKGNPYHKQELDKSGKKSQKGAKSSDLKQATHDPLSASIEPMVSSTVHQAAGDRGNPYYKKTLDKRGPKDTAKDGKSDDSSKSSDKSKPHDKSTNSSNDKTQNDKPLPDVLSSSSTDTTSSKGSEKKSDKADKPQSKEARSGSTISQTEGLPTLATREPPPLFDEDDESNRDSPLFGEDDTVSDTLGSNFKSPSDNKTNDKKTDKLPSKSDLAGDEDLKPAPPPPLFGDDDDDDDELDWLK